MTGRIETLVAADFGPGLSGVQPDLDTLVTRLGDAVIEVTSSTRPHWRTGEPQPVHRVRFDTARLRNTDAHGIGFRTGFVVHIE